MLFLEYPSCSTCKKARKWLDDHCLSYTARHIKENNPTLTELQHWLVTSGLPTKKFFNTSGLLYKSMDLKNTLPSMTQEEQLLLLSSDGMLVKRPIVITDQGKVLVGFREMEWAETLL